MVRATRGDGQLVLWYPAWVPGLWLSLAVLGVVVGFVDGVAGGDPQASILGIGFALIAGFVSWFAVRPFAAMDRSGLELRPAFGTRTRFGWSEITALGVGTVRRGRSRGTGFTVTGADEEASLDGAWLGLTTRQLHRVDGTVRTFARSIGVVGPAAEDAVVTVDEDARYH